MREINHLSLQQLLRSAIPDSQQPISPIGFLFLKLPPPPCAVLLVLNIDQILSKNQIMSIQTNINIYIFICRHACGLILTLLLWCTKHRSNFLARCQLDNQYSCRCLLHFFQLMIAQPCAVKLVKSWSEMSWGAAKHVHRRTLRRWMLLQKGSTAKRISLQQQLEFRGAMRQAGLCTEKRSLTKTWMWSEIDPPENLSRTSQEHLQWLQRFRMCPD